MFFSPLFACQLPILTCAYFPVGWFNHQAANFQISKTWQLLKPFDIGESHGFHLLLRKFNMVHLKMAPKGTGDEPNLTSIILASMFNLGRVCDLGDAVWASRERKDTSENHGDFLFMPAGSKFLPPRAIMSSCWQKVMDGSELTKRERLNLDLFKSKVYFLRIVPSDISDSSPWNYHHFVEGIDFWNFFPSIVAKQIQY